MPVKGRRVIVALSGGSDSMSLLYVLLSLRSELGFTLEAAHVNHCLRGELALRDEIFVRETCENLGIECHVLRADVAAAAKERGLSEEEAGRDIRYAYFRSLGDDAVIATAHNLNDRAETFLFNFTRGASLKGLCSIPPVRDNIIRPVIECSKDEILAYCKENSIKYMTDDTNSDVTYSRNRIRHRVLTELKAINPGFEACAARCIDSLNEDEAYLREQADSVYGNSVCDGGYKIPALAGAPAPLRKRAIALIISENTGITPDSSDINSVNDLVASYASSGGSSAELTGGYRVRTRAGILEFPASQGVKPGETELIPGENTFGDYTVTLSEISAGEYSKLKKQKNTGVFFADADKLTGRLIARPRLEGDEIKPAGRGVTKSVRRLQNECRVPPEMRETSPVICDSSGIVAVTFCALSERVKAQADSRRILKIEIKHSKGDTDNAQ